MSTSTLTMRDVVARQSLFSGASPQTLDYLAEHVVEVRYAPGSCLWLPNSPALLFVVVLDGELEVIRAGQDFSVDLYVAGPGQAAGFDALQAGARNGCTVIARRETFVLATKAEVIRHAVASDAWLRERVAEVSRRHHNRLHQAAQASAERVRSR